MASTNLTLALFTCFALLGSSAPVAAPLAASDPEACSWIADALKMRATENAKAEFWKEVALAMNDPEADLMDAATDAWERMQDRQAAASDVRAARARVCSDVGNGPYHPELEPSQFSSAVTNPWMPMPEGRVLVYDKRTVHGLERIEVRCTRGTVEIAGIACTTLHSARTVDGVLVEESLEYFAQHANGDVWFLGESAREYEDGFLVSIDGSWRAGSDGAQPGVVMTGNPVVGEVCRAAYVMDEDEDLIKVVSLNETVMTAHGTYHNCVVIDEWSPLEPGELDRKSFAPGIGLVLEVDLVTGERRELTAIID
jgi:hypothetical protein